MQISHAEARQLIQKSMDIMLSQNEKELLDFHLQNCPDCGIYRNELNDVEVTLRSAMSKHWSVSSAMPSLDTLRREARPNPQGRLGFQLAMVSLTVILAMFGAWRLVSTNVIPTTSTPPQISPIPTPSTQVTNTRTLAPNCEEVIYIVQQGDTLAGIASRFSTTAETIAEWNQLQSEVLMVGNRINIPVCFTPSATAHLTPFTLTFSPAPLTAASP